MSEKKTNNDSNELARDIHGQNKPKMQTNFSEEALYRVPLAPVKVDTHIHLFPEKLYRAIRKWFAAVGWEIPYPIETGRLVETLMRFGVEEAWALPYAHKPAMADELNRWMGETAQAYSIITGFFTVHPADDDIETLAKRAIFDYGLSGMKLHAEVQDLSVDDDRLDAAFDILEENALPCVLHTGDAPYPFTKPNLDVKTVERRMEKNPQLKAVIAHLGANQTRQYLELTKRFPHLYLEVSFTNFPGNTYPQTIDFDTLEPFKNRLLFGSDFPNLTFTYAAQADAWFAFDWVKEDEKAFFGERAKGLMP